MGACAYARSFAERARAWDGGPIVFSTACDQMRRAADDLCQSCERPVFLLNVPATWQTDAARRLYRTEVERLGAWLARQGGQAHSAAGLTAAMQRYDQARQELPAARAGLSGRQFAEAIARLCQDGPEHLGCSVPPPLPLGEGCGEGADARAPALGERSRRQPVSLALVGGPLMARHFDLFDLIEAFGGRVVLDGTLTGERGLPPPFDQERLARDPFTELVNAYFDGIPDIFRRPNAPCFAWLRQRLAERGARGVILWHYAWCDLWQAEVGRLKEELSLPLLRLDAGDTAELNPQMAKRVQAFLEMLTA